MVEAGANEIPEAEILDALDIAHGGDQEALRRAARAGREGRQAQARGRGAAGRRGPARRRSRARTAPRSTRPPRSRTSSSARTRPRPSRRQVARAVLGRPEAADATPSTAQQRAARVRQAREDDHPRAHRRPQEAPGRPRQRTRSAPISIEVGVAAAHARLGAVHPRPDAGPLRRRARHHARGDAPRQPRARDVQALLPPLQLPAVLGGRGRLHARPQAPRHRPRRARRARAGPDDPVAGGVPVHDPRRVGHPRVQRLVVDGLGLRLLAVADGRRRADQARRSPASPWA